MNDYKINQEIKDLLPKLNEYEFHLLKQSLINEGQKEPIVIFNNIIIDGIVRYQILTELGIEPIFDTETLKECPTFEEAKEYRIKNQLGKRNLEKLGKTYYIGQLYNGRKKNKVENLKQFAKSNGKNFHSEEKTSDILAQLFNINEKTVRNSERFYLATKSIMDRFGVEYRDDIINNKYRLSQGDIIKLSKFNDDKILSIFENLKNKKAHNFATANLIYEQEQTKEKSKKNFKKKFSFSINKVYNGDALTVLKSFDTNSISLIVTDPMYGTDSTFEFDDNKYDALSTLDKVAKELKRVLIPTGHAYFFFSDKNQNEVYHILSKYFVVREQPLTWHKLNMITPEKRGFGYVNSTEHFFFAYQKGGNERPLNKKFVDNVFSVEVEKKKRYKARKPVELMKQLIELSSNENDIVLDPFAGSGSTLEASLEANRRYIGIDINPNAVKIAESNIEKIKQKLKLNL